jgi:hypothetical protein
LRRVTTTEILKPVEPAAADVVRGGVVDEVPEVGPDRGFASADVDVEDLHPLELVDQGAALRRRELARITPAGGGKAVHA